MRFQRSLLLLSAATVAATLTLSAAAEDSKAPAFQFRQVNYFHRWSKDDQNEFTPDKQEDLDHWSDMITTNAYPGVDDGEKMAGTANAVLGNYRSHQGRILKTRSEPATNDRPAEHFISVMFARPEFVEIAFARFKLVEKKGHSFVYSRRFYGEKASEQANVWLKANGDDVEKALMAWEGKVERREVENGELRSPGCGLIAKPDWRAKLARCRSRKPWIICRCKNRRFSGDSRR